MDLELTARWLLIAGVAACLGLAHPAAAQGPDPKPAAAAEKTEPGKEQPAPPPRRDRASQKRNAAGEERPRLDVPVSFPVDI